MHLFRERRNDPAFACSANTAKPGDAHGEIRDFIGYGMPCLRPAEALTIHLPELE